MFIQEEIEAQTKFGYACYRCFQSFVIRLHSKDLRLKYTKLQF